MAAGSTYTPIATTTLGSSATSYTFSSIPATYTDLVIVASVLSADATSKYMTLQFNGDTTTNYSDTMLAGEASAQSARDTNATQIYATGYGAMLTSTTNPMAAVISVMNYANTTTYKTVLGRTNQASSAVYSFVGLWRKTPEAINSIKILATAGNFAAGSTFTLYGITAA